jgi:hypothetical protein
MRFLAIAEILWIYVRIAERVIDEHSGLSS